MAYPMEYRRAVAEAYAACGSSQKVAEQFRCSESWVRRLLQRQRETGSLEPRPSTPPNRSLLKDNDRLEMEKILQEFPDITLAELAEKITKKASIPTLHRALKKRRLSYKKNALCFRTRPARCKGCPRYLV